MLITRYNHVSVFDYNKYNIIMRIVIIISLSNSNIIINFGISPNWYMQPTSSIHMILPFNSYQRPDSVYIYTENLTIILLYIYYVIHRMGIKSVIRCLILCYDHGDVLFNSHNSLVMSLWLSSIVCNLLSSVFCKFVSFTLCSRRMALTSSLVLLSLNCVDHLMTTITEE